MANVEVPKSAKVEDLFSGTYEGHTLRVTLFTGYASDGYKSDFTRRPARWIVWERFDSTGKRLMRRASRFGGNRVALGPTEFASCVKHLRAAGVK